MVAFTLSLLCAFFPYNFFFFFILYFLLLWILFESNSCHAILYIYEIVIQWESTKNLTAKITNVYNNCIHIFNFELCTQSKNANRTMSKQISIKMKQQRMGKMTWKEKIQEKVEKRKKSPHRINIFFFSREFLKVCVRCSSLLLLLLCFLLSLFLSLFFGFVFTGAMLLF